jgi:hypothetical protein
VFRSLNPKSWLDFYLSVVQALTIKPAIEIAHITASCPLAPKITTKS